MVLNGCNGLNTLERPQTILQAYYLNVFCHLELSLGQPGCVQQFLATLSIMPTLCCEWPGVWSWEIGTVWTCLSSSMFSVLAQLQSTICSIRCDTVTPKSIKSEQINRTRQACSSSEMLLVWFESLWRTQWNCFAAETERSCVWWNQGVTAFEEKLSKSLSHCHTFLEFTMSRLQRHTNDTQLLERDQGVSEIQPGGMYDIRYDLYCLYL